MNSEDEQKNMRRPVTTNKYQASDGRIIRRERERERAYFLETQGKLLSNPLKLTAVRFCGKSAIWSSYSGVFICGSTLFCCVDLLDKSQRFDSNCPDLSCVGKTHLPVENETLLSATNSRRYPHSFTSFWSWLFLDTSLNAKAIVSSKLSLEY